MYTSDVQKSSTLVGLVGPFFVETSQGKLRNLWPQMNSFEDLKVAERFSDLF